MYTAKTYTTTIYLIEKDNDGHHAEIEISFPTAKAAKAEYRKLTKQLQRGKAVKISSHCCTINASQILMIKSGGK